MSTRPRPRPPPSPHPDSDFPDPSRANRLINSPHPPTQTSWKGWGLLLYFLVAAAVIGLAASMVVVDVRVGVLARMRAELVTSTCNSFRLERGQRAAGFARVRRLRRAELAVAGAQRGAITVGLMCALTVFASTFRCVRPDCSSGFHVFRCFLSLLLMLLFGPILLFGAPYQVPTFY